MLSPLSNNPIFPAGKIEYTYVQWQSIELAKCSDFYIKNTLASFNDLLQRFQLAQSNLFPFFQVRHFIQSQSSTFPYLPLPHKKENIVGIFNMDIECGSFNFNVDL